MTQSLKVVMSEHHFAGASRRKCQTNVGRAEGQFTAVLAAWNSQKEVMGKEGER
jgi:hypothetical protein